MDNVNDEINNIGRLPELIELFKTNNFGDERKKRVVLLNLIMAFRIQPEDMALYLDVPCETVLAAIKGFGLDCNRAIEYLIKEDRTDKEIAKMQLLDFLNSRKRLPELSGVEKLVTDVRIRNYDVGNKKFEKLCEMKKKLSEYTEDDLKIIIKHICRWARPYSCLGQLLDVDRSRLREKIYRFVTTKGLHDLQETLERIKEFNETRGFSGPGGNGRNGRKH